MAKKSLSVFPVTPGGWMKFRSYSHFRNVPEIDRLFRARSLVSWRGEWWVSGIITSLGKQKGIPASPKQFRLLGGLKTNRSASGRFHRSKRALKDCPPSLIAHLLQEVPPDRPEEALLLRAGPMESHLEFIQRLMNLEDFGQKFPAINLVNTQQTA
jgi:hypothetical protein